MARRPIGTDPRLLAGLVASYVATHPRQPELTRDLDALHGYLGARGIRDLGREELERAVVAHWTRLERETDLRRREAELFTPGRPPRLVRYRHGRPFCPTCGRFKIHRKECPHCGYLELTI